MSDIGRRCFIMKTASAGVGLGLASNAYGTYEMANNGNGKRIGMLGLDTGHCMDFTTILNNPLAGDKYGGYKVVAAYPNGTDNIEEWEKRIPGITDEIKNQGVEIVDSIEQLLEKVDVVLLTCIDGNKHLDRTAPRIDQQLFPRLIALSEVAWTDQDKKDWSDFKVRLNSKLKYLDITGINYFGKN